jgi:hypothetical protein
MLPNQLVEPLTAHLQNINQLYERDLSLGHGAVHLPFALARKYPNAERQWVWQYVFKENLISVFALNRKINNTAIGCDVMEAIVSPAVEENPVKMKRTDAGYF